jgi:hypothetical protein
LSIFAAWRGALAAGPWSDRAVTADLRLICGGRPTIDSPAAVTYLDEDGVEQRAALHEAAGHRFEDGAPVRTFPSYKGQRNWPGWWWSATMRAHVGYESWLERDHAMMLDFDPDIVAFAAQPFWMSLQVDGTLRSHAPDFFVRHRNGSATVIDCRPDERIKPSDAAVFAATRHACEQVGWSYARSGAVAGEQAENVRWLAGYRQARFWVASTVERLLAVFAVPRPLMDGVSWCGPSAAVLPVLYHLMWCHRLSADLATPLSESTMVRTR